MRNLANALEAACGRAGRQSYLVRLARDEAAACYRAAGIDSATQQEVLARRQAMSPIRLTQGLTYKDSSSWQSLARRTGTIEADWLNGEIVLLGRLHGVPTPVNAALRRAANRLARERQCDAAGAHPDFEAAPLPGNLGEQPRDEPHHQGVRERARPVVVIRRAVERNRTGQICRPVEAQYGSRIVRFSSLPAASRGSSSTKSIDLGFL